MLACRCKKKIASIPSSSAMLQSIESCLNKSGGTWFTEERLKRLFKRSFDVMCHWLSKRLTVQIAIRCLHWCRLIEKCADNSRFNVQSRLKSIQSSHLTLEQPNDFLFRRNYSKALNQKAEENLIWGETETLNRPIIQHQRLWVEGITFKWISSSH